MSQEEVAEIVHDLRSPLTTITLETEILEVRLDGADDQLRRSVHRLRRNCAFMARLVEELLDLAAIEQGRLCLRREPVQVQALLGEIVDRIGSQRVRIDAPHGVTLALDPERIERAIANLIDNALKYSAANTEVVVRLDVEPTVVRVSIVDVGPGISERDAATLFQRFHRGTGHGTKAVGTGLGLYVARKIIEAHAGQIGFRTVRGEGSSFFLELPRP